MVVPSAARITCRRYGSRKLELVGAQAAERVRGRQEERIARRRLDPGAARALEDPHQVSVVDDDVAHVRRLPVRRRVAAHDAGPGLEAVDVERSPSGRAGGCRGRACANSRGSVRSAGGACARISR